MKKLLVIALSVFSVSAFAGNGAQSNGLSSDLVQQASAAGISTDVAVKAIVTGEIKPGMTQEQMLEATK